MIEAALTAFGTGGGVTAVLATIAKIYNIKAEASERQAIMASEKGKMTIEMMDSLSRRTNNIWGNSARLTIVLVPQLVILTLLLMGYSYPDTVIWYGQTNEPQNIKLLFGLFEYTSKPETTWRELNGVVILPIVFLQAGAGVAYYLTNGMFSRR